MARPIVIEFTANVAKFLRGTRDIERATDDIADELQGAARASDKFENSFTDSMRDAERAAQRAAQGMRDDFGKAGRGFDNLSDDAREAGQEVGSEFRQTLGETLTSGGGIQDIAADTIGGLVSSMKGGLGLIAAAGGGIALVLFNAFREEAERQRQNLEDELGFVDLLTGELDELAEIQAAVADFGGGSEAEGWRKVQEYADALKLTTGQVLDLIKGDLTPANQKLLDVLKEEQETQGFIEVSAGNEKTIRQDLIRQAETARDVERDAAGLIATRTSALREQGDVLSANARSAQAVLDAVQNLPDRVRVNLEFYATGPGSAYIDPNSGAYSPGHVAVSNMYVRQGRGRP